MKKIMILLAVLSLFILGCSTEVVEEQTVEEKIDEAQAIVEDAMEEVEETTEVEEVVIEEEPEAKEEEEEEEETVVEEVTGTTHLVQVKVSGFDPNTITIKAGDSIQWENVRSGNLNKAMIVGSSPCNGAKSTVLMPGETYSWTFEKPMKCAFTDAITITQLMRVTVEE